MEARTFHNRQSAWPKYTQKAVWTVRFITDATAKQIKQKEKADFTKFTFMPGRDVFMTLRVSQPV